MYVSFQKGARYIYDMGVALQLDSSSISNFLFKNQPKYLVPKVEGILNPFPHFGQPNLLPSGLTISSFTGNTERKYQLKRRPLPVIQHSVYEGHPDPYIYVGVAKDIIRFDHSSPPFLLPVSALAPMPGKNTMFSHEAFWTLFLLPSRKNGQSDIIRSYWAQKLLSIGEYSVAFLPPNKAWNLRREIFMPYQSYDIEEIGEYLISWSCSKSMINCAYALAGDLLNNGLWNKLDYQSFKAWMEELDRMGYRMPGHDSFQVLGETNEMLNILNDKTFTYFPVEQKNPIKNEATSEVLMTRKTFNETCPPEDYKWFEDDHKKEPSAFADIALIVHFNYNAQNNVPALIRLLYKPQFPIMIICGHIQSWEIMNELRLTFIPSYPCHKAQNVLDCDVIAMQMGYKVAGFLQTHDDNILHPWHMARWNRDQIWHTPPHHWYCASGDARTGIVLTNNGSVYDNRTVPYWIHPKEELPNLIPLFDEMNSSPANSVLFKCNLRQMRRLNGPFRFDYSQADHFYVPRRLSLEFAQVLTHFIKYDVFFEIAIPTALKCIEEPSKHHVIQFRHLYGRMKRVDLNITYHMHLNYSYVHPYKLGLISRKKEHLRDLFCGQMLKEIYERW